MCLKVTIKCIEKLKIFTLLFIKKTNYFSNVHMPKFCPYDKYNLLIVISSI